MCRSCEVWFESHSALWLLRTYVTGGSAPGDAMKTLRPPVFYKDADAFRTITRRHTVRSLRRVLSYLLTIEIRVKSTGYPAEAICGQALMSVSGQAGRG